MSSDADPSTSSRSLQEEIERFFTIIGGRSQFTALFDHLPDITFFAKDCVGRFMGVNSLLAQVCGTSTFEILGKLDSDFFPHELAHSFMRDDRWVLSTGKPLVNKMEMVPNRTGVLSWHLTTKYPLFDSEGAVAGLAGIARDLKRVAASAEGLEHFSVVIRHMRDNLGRIIEISELAEIVTLSLSQFERRFKALLGVSPSKYILNMRIYRASQQLEESDASVCSIAHATGFYDHAYFTRQFKKSMGMTPKAFRDRSRSAYKSGSNEY